MQSEAYVEALAEAVRTLQRAEVEVFGALGKVAFAGPFNDQVQLPDKEKVIEQELGMFEHAGDVNLDSLAGVIKHLCQIRKRLINENNLDISLDDE